MTKGHIKKPSKYIRASHNKLFLILIDWIQQILSQIYVAYRLSGIIKFNNKKLHLQLFLVADNYKTKNRLENDI